MSRLGIAFVLPYVGANGIKVVNNEIGLDPNGVGELGALILNQTGVAGAMGTILSIWQDVISGNDSIDILDTDGNTIQSLDFFGKLVINTIQTVLSNPSAPIISFDTALTSTPLPAIPDSDLQATFDGYAVSIPYLNSQ